MFEDTAGQRKEVMKMKRFIAIFTTTLALCVVVTGTTAHAATSPLLKCHLAKVKAASKAFAKMLMCEHSLKVDPAFDLSACMTAAEDKMTAAFAAAETKFGACEFNNNGPTEATTIYQDVIIITAGL